MIISLTLIVFSRAPGVVPKIAAPPRAGPDAPLPLKLGGAWTASPTLGGVASLGAGSQLEVGVVEDWQRAGLWSPLAVLPRVLPLPSLISWTIVISHLTNNRIKTNIFHISTPTNVAFNWKGQSIEQYDLILVNFFSPPLCFFSGLQPLQAQVKAQ